MSWHWDWVVVINKIGTSLIIAEWIIMSNAAAIERIKNVR